MNFQGFGGKIFNIFQHFQIFQNFSKFSKNGRDGGLPLIWSKFFKTFQFETIFKRKTLNSWKFFGKLAKISEEFSKKLGLIKPHKPQVSENSFITMQWNINCRGPIKQHTKAPPSKMSLLKTLMIFQRLNIHNATIDKFRNSDFNAMHAYGGYNLNRNSWFTEYST